MEHRAAPREITVCMPTWRSEPVLEKSLRALRESEKNSDMNIKELLIIDNDSPDRTVEIAERLSKKFGWEMEVISDSISLPAARETAIRNVDTDWFLYLDDDVLMEEEYLSTLMNSVSPAVGAVQGRKQTLQDKQNSKWVQSRAKRGGTHATLIRKKAVADISIPDDLHVLEDEFIRRHIEDAGYLWIFHHQAFFDHQNQGRHSLGWKHGFLAGKYDLSYLHAHVCYAPVAILRGQNIVGQILLILGWLYGYLFHRYEG